MVISFINISNIMYSNNYITLLLHYCYCNFEKESIFYRFQYVQPNCRSIIYISSWKWACPIGENEPFHELKGIQWHS